MTATALVDAVDNLAEQIGPLRVARRSRSRPFTWTVSGNWPATSLEIEYGTFEHGLTDYKAKSFRTRRPGWPNLDSVCGELGSKQFSKWLKTCLKHPACTRQHSLSAPSRLLDLNSADGPKGVVRLIPGYQASGSYVALSYRWGKDHNTIVLTLNRLEEFHKGLEVLRLPALYQDVISVLRAMDVCYLWVDALCIVQPFSDGGTEFNAEAHRMRDVYAGSIFTLSATAATSPKDRLFVERPEWFMEVDGISLPSDSKLKRFCIAARYARSPTSMKISWTHKVSHSSISQRAWTLQERFLAPAVLHFDTCEVFWECRTGISDFIQEMPHLIQSDFKDIFPVLPYIQEQKVLLLQWYQLVEQYSCRESSRIEDRLVAIAGLADHFTLKLQSRYLDGLWEQDILRGLLWIPHLKHPFQMSLQGAEQQRSTTQGERNGAAPTWSWARMAQPVSYIRPVQSPGAQSIPRMDPAGHLPRFLDAQKAQWTEELVTRQQGLVLAFNGTLLRADASRDVLRNWKMQWVISDPLEFSEWSDDGMCLFLLGVWTDYRFSRVFCLILQATPVIFDQGNDSNAGFTGSLQDTEVCYKRIGIAWCERLQSNHSADSKHGELQQLLAEVQEMFKDAGENRILLI